MTLRDAAGNPGQVRHDADYRSVPRHRTSGGGTVGQCRLGNFSAGKLPVV
jgi:hypothetical protein